MNGKLDYPEGEKSILELARNVNDFMPRHMYNLTLNALARAGKSIKGANVTVLGWAFLGNWDDARNTPAEIYYDLLVKAGAIPTVHDKYVEKYPGVAIRHDLDAALLGADAVAVMTGHDLYRSLDPARVKEQSGLAHPVIVDGRNIIDPEPFVKAGFIYKGIGRGDMNAHPIVTAKQPKSVLARSGVPMPA